MNLENYSEMIIITGLFGLVIVHPFPYILTKYFIFVSVHASKALDSCTFSLIYYCT